MSSASRMGSWSGSTTAAIVMGTVFVRAATALAMRSGEGR